MKFAERLEEARIPEYADKYIDYRGLKRILAKLKARVGPCEARLRAQRETRFPPPRSSSRSPATAVAHRPAWTTMLAASMRGRSRISRTTKRS